MCVIVHKPRGIEVNTEALALCHRANTHGGGYMLSTPDGDVYFAKGFTNDEMMVEFLNQFSSEVGVNTSDMEIVFHFRISTAGNINPMNCHPFIIDEKSIYKTQGKVENLWLIAHNGHHSFFPAEWGIDKSELKIYSDTFLLTRDFLALAKPKLRMNVLDHLKSRGQKYAIMLPNGDVKRLGDFQYDEETKCYYSNNFWKPITPRIPERTATQTTYIDTDEYIYDPKYDLWYSVSNDTGELKEVEDDDGLKEMYCEDCNDNRLHYEVYDEANDGSGGVMSAWECAKCGGWCGMRLLANPDENEA